MAEEGVAANNVGPGAAPEAAVEIDVNEPDEHGEGNDAGGNGPPPVENGEGGMPVAGVLQRFGSDHGSQ